MEGKVVIKEINKEKKRIVLDTTVMKVKENKYAILGEAMIYYEKLAEWIFFKNNFTKLLFWNKYSSFLGLLTLLKNKNYLF